MSVTRCEVIYCDDIRQEINGKLSLIGVYSSILYASSFPIVLPTFGMVVRLISPIHQVPTDLQIIIYKGDEVLKHLKPDPTVFQLKDGEIADDAGIYSIQANLTFSPLPIEEPCKLRVVIDTGNEKVEGSPLKITSRPENQQKKPN